MEEPRSISLSVSSILMFCVLLLSFTSCLPGQRSMYLSDAEMNEVIVNRAQKKTRPVIQSGDILSIQIERETGVSERPNTSNADPVSVRSIQHPYLYGYTVNDSGIVAIPTLGNVSLLGLTALQAQEKIQSVAAKFYPNPTVKVNLMNFLVSVLGEVNRPGRFPVYTDRISILQAISEAGDLGAFANREEVRIIRERDGKRMVLNVDLTDPAFLGSDYYFLQPGDVIFVTHLRRKRFVGKELQLGLQGLGVAASILGVIVLLERTQ